MFHTFQDSLRAQKASIKELGGTLHMSQTFQNMPPTFGIDRNAPTRAERSKRSNRAERCTTPASCK
eukprot:11186586-Lingulodinium_polyedra.AAC.1